MTVHVEHHALGRWHRLRNVVDIAVLLAAVAAVAYFWPSTLGGSTHLVVVEGHSMEPTFHLGDIVIARSNPHPAVGDIIVYRIPKGEAAQGMMIIHRVKSVRTDGTYETQGDNRTTPDPFDITPADILGSPVLAIPHAGRLIGLSANPLVVALSAGLLTVFLLWPKKKVPDEPGDPVGATVVDVDVDAEAWLRSQLPASAFGDVDAECGQSARLLECSAAEPVVLAR